jgi:hypothetical protein
MKLGRKLHLTLAPEKPILAHKPKLGETTMKLRLAQNPQMALNGNTKQNSNSGFQNATELCTYFQKKYV